MRALYFIFFFFAFGSISAQTVSGVVQEKGSGLPLPFANIFVNNTTQGIATDGEGKFSLSGDFPAQIELVASFVGYVTQVRTISFENNNEVKVIFELAFNESNLSEVELKAKRDKSWERNFRKFESVFLALPDDPYKSQIEILNPWVIEYDKINPDKGANYIRAYAKEPLLIKNEALGYEIEYHLQDFRMLRTGSSFSGQVFFRSLNSSDSKEQFRWEQARQSSYISSLRHLNQSILLNVSNSVYFEMFRVVSGQLDRRRTNVFNLELNETIIPLENSSILRRPLGDKTFRIFLPDKIEIHHLGKKWGNDYYKDIFNPISWIEAPDGYYDIDRNGVLIDPTKLILSGYLARERVARALPLDFEVKPTLALSHEKSQISNSKAEFQINKLREKVWLTTSKPYFYPGETAWIGGRVLYQDPFLADSLSRVLYVDILKANNEIVQSATFPILQGKISGALVLAQDLSPGDYGLRAYTHWNRNFPESDQFIAPFIVMEAGFIPELTEAAKESFPGNIKVKSDAELSDSLNFRMMDLQLTFMDEFDNPIAAEFVLSISDADQVTELTEESSLEQATEWLDEDLPETFQNRLSYSVEYGISLKGKFIPDNQRQGLIQPITIVRGDLEDYGQVMTDSSGYFWATGLSYQDTAQIAVAAVNQKLKPFGSVELESLGKPELGVDLPKLTYQKVPILSKDYFLDTSGDYMLLEEFVKEETRERETMAERNYGYGAPTQEVGPKELEKLTMPEILGLLRFNTNTAKFGNYNFGEKVGAPLLILDGSPRPYMEKGELLDFLLNSIEPSQLLSIKVYSDNISKAVFGMAGYAGVIMIETKKGFRINPEIQTKFNSEGFQFFTVPGFTAFPEFSKAPSSDRYLTKKPTIYWDPLAETTDGVYKVKIKVPYGVERFSIKVEGRSLDGEVIFEMIEINK
ncbi:CarboxypepD_reg-like domain-containing protein [Algoriphagus alkaliphilus]|uniref:CarboxypepD_reg-like domain-containing protein n=1 Tax=Algoriphagus alkaliphilus TaxID=279824 RepID=A0A1G5ZB23_9BACT|nr:carboxypeptidase-like regulatory domain-containing protein [Algoriphagus alkaliphilus]SDA92148.1 CarboxypepD_reg-like domain-containing protein [Algoriphagus alkaliphilus]